MSFTPTNKQLEAIEKMENFCKVSSHRTNFESKQEFDDYFVRLQKRGNKKAKTLDNISSWKTSYSEIQKKKQESKRKYYNDYNTLRSYAIEYINRYFPSIRQTEDKLLEKSNNPSLVWKVLNSVKHLIEEEKMIKALVSQLKHRGKNINYISNKLYTKKYDWVLIKKTINKLRSEGTLLIDYTLEDKFTYYMRKGLSKNEIRKKFIERNEDREVVDTTLEKVFWEEWEIDNLEVLIDKLKAKKVDGKKIINRLLGKWYRYQDIVQVLNG